MLRFVCDQRLAEGKIHRREWLRLSGLAGLGFLAPPHGDVSARSSATAGFGKARSVVLIYTSGGQYTGGVHGAFQADTGAVAGSGGPRVQADLQGHGGHAASHEQRGTADTHRQFVTGAGDRE